MKQITKQWLEYAETDLKNCQFIINDEFLTNLVAFHSQQTVEKCFKAIIEEKDIKQKRIHNLIVLYENIKEYIDFNLDEYFLELLDRVYTMSRYPGESGLLPQGKPDIDEAKEMYEFANQVYIKISKMLEKE